MRTGSEFINTPTVFSMLGTCADLPDTMIPNTMSCIPVLLARRRPQALWTIEFSVSRSDRPNRTSALVALSDRRLLYVAVSGTSPSASCSVDFEETGTEIVIPRKYSRQYLSAARTEWLRVQRTKSSYEPGSPSCRSDPFRRLE